MILNENSALAVAKELTIVAMQNNMIKAVADSTITAKNVTDFYFTTFNALTGNTDKTEKS